MIIDIVLHVANTDNISAFDFNTQDMIAWATTSSAHLTRSFVLKKNAKTKLPRLALKTITNLRWRIETIGLWDVSV